MTTATQLTPDELTILKLAVRGRGVSFIAEALNKPREHIGRVLAKHGGHTDAWQWAIDEHDGDTTPRIPTRAPTAPPPRPLPPPAQPAATNGQAPAGKLEQLLTRAAKTDTAPVRKARSALLAAVDRLETTLANTEVKHREKQAAAAEKAAARAKVESLERQLREAKAALRGKKPGDAATPTKRPATPAAGRDIDYVTRVIREWAQANNIPCPTAGRYLPADLVAAYKAAHPERTSA